jgi:hypothetical protein
MNNPWPYDSPLYRQWQELEGGRVETQFEHLYSVVKSKGIKPVDNFHDFLRNTPFSRTDN